MKIGDKVLVTAAHKVGWREMKKRVISGFFKTSLQEIQIYLTIFGMAIMMILSSCQQPHFPTSHGNQTPNP